MSSHKVYPPLVAKLNRGLSCQFCKVAPPAATQKFLGGRVWPIFSAPYEISHGEWRHLNLVEVLQT